MVKKQISLNLHYVSCNKIRERFEPMIMVSARGDMNQQEFCTYLAKLKLLKDDFPHTDERWINFYSKFRVTDDGKDSKRFSLIPALIALYFLSQGSTEHKAKAICDLFSDDTFF